MSGVHDQLIAWLGTAAGEAGQPGASGPSDAATLGGKGASLHRLGTMGFTVPPAFCLTTAAFRTQLAAAVDDALGAPAPIDVPAVAESLVNTELVASVGGALAGALDRLGSEVAAAGFEPRYAVRSSALGEDGSAASYAGLHETELDVSPEGVAAAVRRCWASLWSPAAIAYRRRRELSPADAEMAVVVQALVPAEASAVVFTRHPVTGREDQLVLTAVRGLGDAMVAGTVTPDTYVVDRASRATLSFDPGDGAGGAGGAGGGRATGVLDGPALADLVDLSLAVEAGFGRAVDIEAAIAGGTWYLLQARPITTGIPAGPA